MRRSSARAMGVNGGRDAYPPSWRSPTGVTKLRLMRFTGKALSGGSHMGGADVWEKIPSWKMSVLSGSADSIDDKWKRPPKRPSAPKARKAWATRGNNGKDSPSRVISTENRSPGGIRLAPLSGGRRTKG